MGGKIFVSEQSDVADFRAEQGIIRSEPGGFRSRYVLIPPQQGIQQPQCRSQYGKNTLFPVSGSGIRSRREHDDGRGDKAQIRYALIIKPGGKPCPDKEIAASQTQGQPARQSGAGNLVSPENTEAEQQEGCRQKAGGKEKGVPFPACRRRCQEDVKKGQQAARIFPAAVSAMRGAGEVLGGESGMVGNLSGRLQYKRGKLPCQEQAPCCMREDASKCQSSGGQDGKGVRKPDRIK